MKEGSFVKYPLKNKMVALILTSMVPLLCVIIYLMISLNNYSKAYDKIVSNMTIANHYNLDFKEQMDESLYKLVVGCVDFESIDEDPTLRNPYDLLEEFMQEGMALEKITTDQESKIWIQSVLRNIKTLYNRVDDIKYNLETGGKYNQNIEMLDNNIYILTELIQDDIQYYIYYQARSIEQLKIQLNNELNHFIVFCIFLVSCIVVAVIVTVGITVNNITKPIRKLCDITKKIAEGDFSSRAKLKVQDDEVAILAESFNEMSEKLEVMVQKIKEDERKMRYAELRLLQEQINPHFLYNTLDTIVWLIEGNAADKAEDMVIALSDFFRLVLSKGKEYISICDEKHHIESYLQIQQVRYADILDYKISIDPEIYDYKILKLTLQPLVENSLYHGIKYKRAKGTIEVKGYLENGMIHLSVSDDGVGMKEEELEQLKAKILKPCKETDSGFGLANVNERIRMNYGMEYGMKISSKEGEGTQIDIVIPANRM